MLMNLLDDSFPVIRPDRAKRSRGFGGYATNHCSLAPQKQNPRLLSVGFDSLHSRLSTRGAYDGTLWCSDAFWGQDRLAVDGVFFKLAVLMQFVIQRLDGDT